MNKDMIFISDSPQFELELRALDVTVIDAHRDTHTTVTTTTSGGGGSIVNGTGSIAPVKTQTSTQQHTADTIFFRYENGDEDKVHLDNVPLIWRNGSRLRMFWVIGENGQELTGLHNLDTTESSWFAKGVSRLIPPITYLKQDWPWLRWVLLVLFGPGIVAGVLSASIGTIIWTAVVAAICWLFYHIVKSGRTHKQLIAEMRART